MRGILFPFSVTYRGVTGVRNWFYDRSLLRAEKIACPVISIGNLTMGGTGKTPTAIALVDLLKSKGFKPGVVSRGYKRSGQGIAEVEASATDAALRFGDEPALIKHHHSDIPVIVAEKRADAARLAVEKGVDIVVADDAFQHRSLHRDLNILLFDVTEPVANYRVLPVGRARESLKPALKRADFIVLTKTNLVEPSEREERLNWLRKHTDKPVIEAEYSLVGFRGENGERRQDLKDKAFLVTGVAKPQTVERLLEGRVKLVKHKVFGDHHRFKDIEVETFLDEASTLQARWILCTGKDAVKLGGYGRLRERLWVIELGVKFKGETKALYEAIDRLARSRV